jgi:hypothetical protein
MLRITSVTLLYLIHSCFAFSQNTEEEYLKEYEIRIKQERINDVYIPKNVNDAMKELDRLTNDKEAEKLKTSSEDTIASKLHFNLGRWMQIHWGLEDGSRLSHYLKSKGVTFPDDMMDLLIRCWYRHIKKIPLNENDLIDKYIAKRREEHAKRFKSIDTIRIEKKQK